MSTGLLALLDDVVALTKLAAATLDDAASQAAKVGAKTAGVVVDDAAVTPRYVTGLASDRELPIVGRIAMGSMKNKLVFLLPIALALSVFAPWAITPILMVGGLYLCFEGYEKVHEMFASHSPLDVKPAADAPVISAQALEDQKVAGAIRTDLVLSAEIMAIALANITTDDLAFKALVLAVVAVMVTVGVYGAVALIVKADDFGVWLAHSGNAIASWLGRGIVIAMPHFLKLLSFIGMIAMLWVGGGILIHGLNTFGYSVGEHLLHATEVGVYEAIPGALGGVVAWLATASISAVVGLIAGALTALFVIGLALPAWHAIRGTA